MPRALTLALLISAIGACGDAESIFTDGRIETRCNSAIPICDSQASCVLLEDQYLRDDFPGGKQFMVRTAAKKTRLTARFLLIEPRFTGTELMVRVHNDSCGAYEEGATRDKDLFDESGEDSIIEYQLDIVGEGDHLVEIFSDMSSEFLFRFDHQE